MSEDLDFIVQYNAPWGAKSVRACLDAIQRALNENWRDANEWSDAESRVDFMFDEPLNRWIAQSASANKLPSVCVSISPLSCYAIWLHFGSVEPDRSLTVSVSISEKARWEMAGDRERGRMTADWQERREREGKPIRFGSAGGPPVDDPQYAEWWQKWDSLADTPSVWPRVCKALERILQRLCEPLRVTHVWVDKILLGAGFQPDRGHVEWKVID
jgi:hypothetical protein